MSGELTQAGANRAARAGVGQAVSAAAGMYMALATALPSGPDTATLAAWGSVEVSTSGYGRQAVIWDAPSGDPSEVQSAGDITFGPFTADPPSIGYAFLCDTSIGTSGDCLAFWTLEVARDAENGDSLRFSAGEIRLSVD